MTSLILASQAAFVCIVLLVLLVHKDIGCLCTKLVVCFESLPRTFTQQKFGPCYPIISVTDIGPLAKFTLRVRGANTPALDLDL